MDFLPNGIAINPEWTHQVMGLYLVDNRGTDGRIGEEFPGEYDGQEDVEACVDDCYRPT